MTPLLEVGGTCFRRVPCHEAALLVDASDYYRAFCQAAQTAERRVLLAGWQYRAHKLNNPLRVTKGLPQKPYHDTMVAVTGPAACELEGLFIRRWQAATGERLEPLCTGDKRQSRLFPRPIDQELATSEPVLRLEHLFDPDKPLSELELAELVAPVTRDSSVGLSRDAVVRKRVGDAG